MRRKAARSEVETNDDMYTSSSSGRVIRFAIVKDKVISDEKDGNDSAMICTLGRIPGRRDTASFLPFVPD